MDHQFDYRRLRFDEPHVEDGGPRSYRCTVLPTFLALVMIAAPTPESAVVAYRLFNLFCVAVVLAVQFQRLHQFRGTAPALLACIATACVPLFAVQIEMLGMDVPLAALAMIWWSYMQGWRPYAALAVAILGFLVKPSAFLLPAAAAAYYGLVIFAWATTPRSAFPLKHLLALLLNTAAFFAEFWILSAAGNLHGRVIQHSDLLLWVQSSPDLIVLIAVALFFELAAIRRELAEPPGEVARGAGKPLPARFLAWCQRAQFTLVGWATVLLTMAAAAMTYYESRHLTLVVPFAIVLLTEAIPAGRLPKRTRVPFAVVLLAHAILRVTKSRWPACAALAAVAAFGLANRYGAFYPSLGNGSRGWGVPERSMEYRADHDSNIRAARTVHEQRGNDAVIASEHFIYFLTVPRLAYGAVPNSAVPPEYRFTAIDGNLLRIVEDQPESVVVVRVPSPLGSWPFPAYHIAEPTVDDEILFHDDIEPATVVYRRRFPREGSSAERMRRYVDLLFANATDLDPAVRIAVAGDEKLAQRYITAEMGGKPGETQTILELECRLQRFIDRLDELLKQTPDDFFLLRQQGTMMQRMRDVQSGKPLQQLPWSQRTLMDTWAQRLCYIPAPSVRAESGRSAEPANFGKD